LKAAADGKELLQHAPLERGPKGGEIRPDLPLIALSLRKIDYFLLAASGLTNCNRDYLPGAVGGPALVAGAGGEALQE
jgi:hypothetical protein